MSDAVERIRSCEADPIVGFGADGARRTAQVYRDELATLAADDPRRDELEARAAAWDQRARASSAGLVELDRPGRLGLVERELEAAGYWYPPDAIRAAVEGRQEYHPLAGATITYTLPPHTAGLITRAVDRVAARGWRPPR